VPAAGRRLVSLTPGCPPLKRPVFLHLPRNVLVMLRLVMSTISACLFLLRVRPRAVFTTGGYGSLPVSLAARLLRVPSVAHELNATPGVATRVASWLGAVVLSGWDEETLRAALPPWRRGGRRAGLYGPHRVVGVPTRPDVRAASRAVDDMRLYADGAGDEPARVLVLGGSLGAPDVWRAALAALPIARRGQGSSSPPSLEATVQVGPGNLKEAEVFVANSPACAFLRDDVARGGIRVTLLPFVDDIAQEYARADVVVARSGASTCAELLAAGRASVLLPLRPCPGDHQARNARRMEAGGAAVVVVDGRDVDGDVDGGDDEASTDETRAARVAAALSWFLANAGAEARRAAAVARAEGDAQLGAEGRCADALLAVAGGVGVRSKS